MTIHLKIIKGFILSLIDLMENNWLNPLYPDESDLVGLSTGTVAPPAVVKDLLRALEVGEEAYQTFKQPRLDDDPPSVKFHDKMTKQRLKTFSTIGTKTARTKGQNVVLKADGNLFSQMILVAESISVNMKGSGVSRFFFWLPGNLPPPDHDFFFKSGGNTFNGTYPHQPLICDVRKLPFRPTLDTPLKDVLAHPLGPLPWALANADGSLRKTNKATLARELEKNVSPAEAIPTPSTCIIDGMGLVQRMNGNNKTFAQLAESVMAMVLYVGGRSGRVDVVFDVYRQPSIKYSERLNRCASTTVQYTCLARGHNIQQWRKFLSSSLNKTSLISR